MTNDEDLRASDVALATAAVLWGMIRIPVLGLLIILEPFVSVALVLLGALLVGMACFYHYLTRVPHDPFWGMLGAGVACGVALLGYYALIRLFSTPLRSRRP